MNRLDDLPIYELLDGTVSALHFNHVQVALKRLKHSLRYPIPKLRYLDLILEKDAWVIVDRLQNDIPVAAWTDFVVEDRNNLHESIQCKIRLYHANANLILERTLDAMELLLGEELAELSDDDFNVIQFSKTKDKAPS